MIDVWVKGHIGWNKGISKYPELNDREWLFQKYEIEQLTSRQIAKIVGCSGKTAVLTALRNLGFTLRKQKQHELLKDRDWLNQKYWDEELNCREISEIVGCDRATAYRALKRHNIETRTAPDAQRGKPKSEEAIRKNRESHKGLQAGKDNPFYGKHHNEKIKQKISESHRGLIPWNKGKKGIYSEETLEKLREARKHQKFPKHHTKPERIFEDFCKKGTLPFRYTGDSRFWIGEKPSLNPDFVHLTKKIVVEIFSWHHNELQRIGKVRYSHTYEGRKKLYKKYGYKMIVFWQEDLEREDAESFVLSILKKEGVI